jgi:hypothetical protein
MIFTDVMHALEHAVALSDAQPAGCAMDARMDQNSSKSFAG